jgi:hypothetical protein
MNKKNLIRKAALEADLSLGDEKKAVDAFLCAISDMLRENKEVIIPTSAVSTSRTAPSVSSAILRRRALSYTGYKASEIQAFRERNELCPQVWKVI